MRRKRQNPANRTGALVLATGVVLLLAPALECIAQERTVLRKIEVQGLQRLSPAQVIAASGLRIGDPIDAATIDAAADRLMRSGWFISVSYRVRSADNDTTVTFDVVEKAPATTKTPTAPSETLGQVLWSGNAALSSQELSTAFNLQPGESAPRARIDQALEGVKKAYGRRGYINAQIAEAVTRDVAARRINYQFTIREGQQFRMGGLTIAGLNGIDTRALRGKWTLGPGAVFDDSYLEQFRTTVIRPFVASLAQRTGVRSKFEVNIKPDTQKQTADVIITFK